VGGVQLFDLAQVLPAALRADPYFYGSQVVPVYVYTSADEADIAAKYELLQLRPVEIGLFAWRQAEQVEFRLKLGATLQPLARPATATATRQARAVLPLATVQTQAWSASELLGLFGLAGEPLLDPARVGPLADEAAPYNPILSYAEELAAPPRVPPTPKPNQLDVVVGLFFDGTGNNRYATELIYNQFLDKDLRLDENALNSLLRRLLQAKKQQGQTGQSKAPMQKHPSPKRPPVPLEQYMLDTEDPSSFLNAYSNVVLLHDLYQTRAYDPRRAGQRQQVILKHYVQGIGTLADLDAEGIPVKYYNDDVLGMSAGRGLRGVIARVEQGLQHVAAQLNELLQAPGVVLGSLTFDVFGFSRGATAARHCLNELLLAAEKGAPDTPPAYGRLGTACQALGVKLPATLNLRFAGLFDTVVSDNYASALKRRIVNAAASDEKASLAYEEKNDNEPIYTALKDFKGRAIHIIAQDEYRENFPLTACDAPNKKELSLYGVHSDIGGGYADTNYKTLVTYFDETITAIGISADELKRDLADISLRYRQRFTSSLKNGRWVPDAIGTRRPPRRRVYATIGQKSTSVKGEPVKYRYFIYDEGYISNKIQLVGMNAMLQYALADKLPLQPDYKKAKVPNGRFYELPPNPAFQAYYDSIIKLVAGPKTIGVKKTPCPGEVYFPLSELYVHESAGYNKSIHFNTPGNNDNLLDVYVNKPNTAEAEQLEQLLASDKPNVNKFRQVELPIARPKKTPKATQRTPRLMPG